MLPNGSILLQYYCNSYHKRTGCVTNTIAILLRYGWTLCMDPIVSNSFPYLLQEGNGQALQGQRGSPEGACGPRGAILLEYYWNYWVPIVVPTVPTVAWCALQAPTGACWLVQNLQLLAIVLPTFLCHQNLQLLGPTVPIVWDILKLDCCNRSMQLATRKRT